MTKYIIKCQVKEWYGCEDHIGDPCHGRYKMKGGQDFIFEADESVMYDEDKVIESFNETHDKVGRFWRYEAKSIDYYEEPVAATIVNGKIVIPYI